MTATRRTVCRIAWLFAAAAYLAHMISIFRGTYLMVLASMICFGISGLLLIFIHRDRLR